MRTRMNAYADFDSAVAAGDRSAALLALSELSDYYKDLLTSCRECGALERKMCIGEGVGADLQKVHLSRQHKRRLEGSQMSGSEHIVKAVERRILNATMDGLNAQSFAAVVVEIACDEVERRRVEALLRDDYFYQSAVQAEARLKVQAGTEVQQVVPEDERQQALRQAVIDRTKHLDPPEHKVDRDALVAGLHALRKAQIVLRDLGLDGRHDGLIKALGDLAETVDSGVFLGDAVQEVAETVAAIDDSIRFAPETCRRAMLQARQILARDA